MGLRDQGEEVAGEADPRIADGGTPCSCRPRAATRPACWSEMTGRTLVRPRSRRLRKTHLEHLPAAVGGNSGRDYYRHRRHLTGVTDVQLGGVKEHVRDAGVVQQAGPSTMPTSREF